MPPAAGAFRSDENDPKRHEGAGFAAVHDPDLLYCHDPWVWGQRDEALKEAGYIEGQNA